MSDSDLPALAAELRLAVFRMRRRLRLETPGDPISEAQLAVIHHLEHLGPQPPGVLAELELVSAPAIHHTINRLESGGLVRRRADPDDGRRVFIELTASGAELVKETKRARNAWLESRLEQLDPGERSAVAQTAEFLLRIARD